MWFKRKETQKRLQQSEEENWWTGTKRKEISEEEKMHFEEQTKMPTKWSFFNKISLRILFFQRIF